MAILARCSLFMLAARVLLALTGATAASAASPPAGQEDLRGEAFIAAQSAMISEAANALARVATRFARGDDAIAPLEAARQRSVDQLRAADARLIGLIGSSDKGSGLAQAAAAADRDKIRAAIDDLDKRIEAIDPGYSELTRPQPLSIADTQALLAGNEALLLVLPTNTASYVFAVTREGATWNRAAITGVRVAALVTDLRRSMIHDLETGAASFDRKEAYELYDALVRPVESQINSKHEVIVVTDGALGTLPLQLLVTDPPVDSKTDDAAMRGTHWLIDRYALSTLPSVSSLRALRCLLVRPDQRAPACGMQADQTRARPIAAARPVWDVVGFGDPTLAPAVGNVKGGGSIPQADTVFNGGLADPDILRRLKSLPGAKAELEMVGKLFGQGRADIEMGADATETRVKTSTTLPAARFVLFSTHGLLASESRMVGATEPGLVFTPPQGAGSSLDDGLLTSSEAAKLKLNADLVVLSACNTAASDGTPGAEGLSGLARAFFYAGAHALIVSNWVVNDLSTMELVSKIFTAARASQRPTMSDVLRDAELNVRAMPNFAAPAFWAPFVLVGAPN